MLLYSTREKAQLKLLNSIVTAFGKNNIDYWVFGGFAVDGLLGNITRPHHDIDILIKFDDRDKVAELLTSKTTYDFLVITRWLSYKFITYDPKSGLNADFGFLTLNNDCAKFTRAGKTFTFPITIVTEGKKVELEGISFGIVSPTFLYASKYFSKRPANIKDNIQRELVDKKEADLLKHLIDHKLFDQISNEMSELIAITEG